jgi:ketosteroid isomerase-like protein
MKAPDGWEQCKAAWIEVPKMRVTIYQAAKAGNTALYRALCNHHGVKLREDEQRGTRRIKGREVHVRYPWQVREDWPRIAVVREPLARFESLWKNKARDHGTGCRQIHGLTPDELADFIEAHPRSNSHWQSQAAGMGGLDATLYPLERWADDGWPTLSDTPYPSKPFQINATGGEIPPYDRERVLELYSDDVELYNRAQELFHGKAEN